MCRTMHMAEKGPLSVENNIRESLNPGKKSLQMEDR